MFFKVKEEWYSVADDPFLYKNKTLTSVAYHQAEINSKDLGILSAGA